MEGSIRIILNTSRDGIWRDMIRGSINTSRVVYIGIE